MCLGLDQSARTRFALFQPDIAPLLFVQTSQTRQWQYCLLVRLLLESYKDKKMLPFLPLPLTHHAPTPGGSGGTEPYRAPPLSVTEWDQIEFGKCAAVKYHHATVSVAEMAIAEYCFFLLKAHADQVDKWHGDPPLEELDLIALFVQEKAEKFWNMGAEYQARVGPSPAQENFEAWRRLERLVDRLQSHDGPNNESAAEAREFLTGYLQRRGLPPGTSPAKMTQSRLHRYEEYFTTSFAYVNSSAFTKTVCAKIEATEASNGASGVVGVVMLSDEARVYNWSLFQDSEAGRKPQWRMEGIIACPFYTAARQGGVGRALVDHIGERIRADPSADTVAVSVASNAPDFWKEKLSRTEFINCSGCNVRKRKIAS